MKQGRRESKFKMMHPCAGSCLVRQCRWWCGHARLSRKATYNRVLGKGSLLTGGKREKKREASSFSSCLSPWSSFASLEFSWLLGWFDCLWKADIVSHSKSSSSESRWEIPEPPCVWWYQIWVLELLWCPPHQGNLSWGRSGQSALSGDKTPEVSHVAVSGQKWCP